MYDVRDMRFTSTFLAVAGLLVVLPSADAVGTYRLQDLGAFEDGYSAGAGLNATGAATGIFSIDALTRRAFRYASGAMQDLGTLGGAESFGSSINDSGYVVGKSYVAGDARVHAFYAGDGPMRDLGTLGGTDSDAYGVNAAGRVVGVASLRGDLSSHAYLSAPDGGALQDLGTLGGDFSTGEAVNDADQVVGTSFTSGGDFHGFLWQNGAMQDLGTLGGNSRARAISSNGLIVGFSDYGTGSSFAVRFVGGMVENLGAIAGDTGSQALGVNASGVVVGESFLSGSIPLPRAFVYDGGMMFDLRSLVDASGAGWTFSSAAGVNDAGQIVGTGYIEGRTHAFVLTPVPEPTSLAALGLGALAVLRRRNRRHS